jgi:hypothetical protein
MTVSVRINQLTTEAPGAALWSREGIDPLTVIHTSQDGSYTALTPAGTPVEVPAGHLREAVERVASGGCPRCGGRWGEAHTAAGACPAPGIAKHLG